MNQIVAYSYLCGVFICLSSIKGYEWYGQL